VTALLTRNWCVPAAVAAFFVAACGSEPGGTLTASGTIEVQQSDVASLVPARILDLKVEEGDSVRAGDTLVLLTQSTLASDIDMRRARVSAAEEVLRDLEAGARPEEINRARAELSAADAEATRTRADATRAESMFKAGAISQAELDLAKTAASTAAARRDALKSSVELLEAGTREARIRSARAEVQAARAALNAALAANADLVLTAPASGVVLARHVEKGEVIGAGVPTLSIAELNRPWVRVFVAAPALPRLHVGMVAQASVAGVADRVFDGRVVAIDSRAQFTPRIALTKDERADLMFGVKVELADDGGLLKPGLPVDVRFDTTAASPPARKPGDPGG
jgi:HlyD family secretion protein